MLTWNISSFFLEIRIITSTFFILYLFYLLGIFNSLLKEYFEIILTKKLKLKVKIKNINFNLFQGYCEINEATLFHPIKEIDSRWNSSVMAYAEKTIFTFDPILLFYSYIINPYKLLVFNTISVNGIDLFIEGYEEEGKKTILNLKLIGGEIKSNIRLRKPTYLQLKELQKAEKRKKRQQLAQARAQAIRARSGSLTFHRNSQGNLFTFFLC